MPHGCWQVEKSLGQVGGVLSLGAPRLSVGIPREDSGGVNPLPTPTSKAAFISRFEIGPKTCSSDTRTHRGGVRVHPSDTPERRSDASARRSDETERGNLPSAKAKRPFSSLGTPFSALAKHFPRVATPPPTVAEAVLGSQTGVAGSRDSHPLRAQQLRLCQHRLHRFFLQVRRVAVFVQDALHHHFNFRAGAFAEGPVDGHALGKCECRSANYEVRSVRHLKFLIRHFPDRPRVRVRLLDGRAG